MCFLGVGLWFSAIQRGTAFIAINALTNSFISVRRVPVPVTGELGADASAAEGITCEWVMVMKCERCARDRVYIVDLTTI